MAATQQPKPSQASPTLPKAATAQAAQSSDDEAAALNAELFYEILVSEMTASSGDPGTAYALMLEAARRSRDGQLYRRATEIALQARSGQSALIAAQAWKEALPQSRDANRFLLQILIALNRIDETPDLLQQELAASTPRTRIATIQALPQLYGRASDKAQATAVVEKALANELTNPAVAPSAWITIGRMRLASGDKAGALEAARRASELEPTNDGAALLALLLTESGVKDAEALLKPYFAGTPIPEIRMTYARVLLESQRFAEAQTQLEAVTRERPDMAEAWLVDASLNLQANRLPQAEASLQKFLALLEPLPPSETRANAQTQAYLLLSQVAEKRGDFAQADAWLNRIDNPAALISAQSRRASLLARQGKITEARAILRALPAKTADEEKQKLLAEVQLLREVQQYDAAYEVQSQAVARYPDDIDLAYEQAMLAERLGKLDVMERQLRAIIARQPGYQHAYNALGYSFAERGVKLQEARELIAKALQLAPGDPFITDSLGWVEFKLGHREEAARLLQEAFKAQPDAEIGAHLGEVLWSMGQQDQAKAVWRQGQQLNPDNGTLKDTLKRLGVSL
ncbi:Flp pilus assembly protein TadD, contains TPR repeats [Paracidovorax wautersii]|uniref:Flp pilus assembly protein TadD, contains TPR repeats n=2 Tax=Paracidovorax wautersii TaxID=1177982 RepID=A0A1I2GCQ5_9BURK|nr:Flp pilus assembly protein TadD, contains TPR repeats [Paracidovorax wautersii]